jgi:hypothetical protein
VSACTKGVYEVSDGSESDMSVSPLSCIAFSLWFDWFGRRRLCKGSSSGCSSFWEFASCVVGEGGCIVRYFAEGPAVEFMMLCTNENDWVQKLAFVSFNYIQKT